MNLFKRCPKCAFQWPKRDDFLSDPHISLVGYQVNYKILTAGYMLFNHHCKTTLALPVIVFRELYDGPVFADNLAGRQECPGLCLYYEDLTLCPAQCECAYVRHILQEIKAWPKNRMCEPPLGIQPSFCSQKPMRK
jgi:hypothetical protein